MCRNIKWPVEVSSVSKYRLGACLSVIVAPASGSGGLGAAVGPAQPSRHFAAQNWRDRPGIAHSQCATKPRLETTWAGQWVTQPQRTERIAEMHRIGATGSNAVLRRGFLSHTSARTRPHLGVELDRLTGKERGSHHSHLTELVPRSKSTVCRRVFVHDQVSPRHTVGRRSASGREGSGALPREGSGALPREGSGALP